MYSHNNTIVIYYSTVTNDKKSLPVTYVKTKFSTDLSSP